MSAFKSLCPILLNLLVISCPMLSEGSSAFAFPRNRFKSYGVEDGLASNNIPGGAREDVSGRLCFCNKRGRLGLLQVGIYTSFGAEYRFAMDSIKVVYKVREDVIWIGAAFGLFEASEPPFGTLSGRDGVAVINPQNVRVNTTAPTVLIEEILVDNKVVPLGREIRVGPEHISFEARYVGLSFIRPEQMRYRYKLIGFDKDWVEAGNRREALYNHIPAGEYTFTVIATKGDGLWSESGLALRVIVVPPFWRRVWFLSLAGLGIAAVIAILYGYRIRQLKKAHAMQEAFSRQLIYLQESERKRIAVELHDSLGQNLLVIKNWAQMGLLALNPQERAHKHLLEISTTASQAVEEIREISYNLRPHLLDEVGLSEAVRSMLRKVGHSSGIEFHSDIDQIDGLFPEEAEINLYRIVQESVNNVIKHAHAARVSVALKMRKQELLTIIEDDGIGFPTQPGARDRTKGSFGLKDISERAHMLGGKYFIYSTPGKGTTVIVRIDLKKVRIWKER